jgi:ferrous iron transport protein A
VTSAPTRLLDAETGRATVVSLGLSDGPIRRLSELGVRVGARIEVHRRTSGGGIVIGVAGSRVALDRASARSITVEQPAPGGGG